MIEDSLTPIQRRLAALRDRPVRTSAWIQTYSGRKFYPFDPRVEDICIEDIAHALSLQCRFTGHVQKFYSVAQHSALVCDLCPRTDQLYGLLHDASEAYLTDVARPIKHHESFALYREIEEKVMAVVWKRFGLDPLAVPASVKAADELALAIEARSLMGSLEGWDGIQETEVRVIPVSPSVAEKTFLSIFYRLIKGA